MQRPDASEIQAFIAQAFPTRGSEPRILIEEVSEERARLRWRFSERGLRPGQTISGPTMMALADTAAWTMVLHNRGFAAAASVTSSLSIHFLSRPAAGDLIAETRLLRIGRRLSVSEVSMYSDGAAPMVAHATVTYAVVERG